ncbi:MAG: NAD(P)-binding domain-containing protein [Actinobacteria bacterium]|nr:NAD(P)-binding domain-containing protein [Actinomycetota bacterium]
MTDRIADPGVQPTGTNPFEVATSWLDRMNRALDLADPAEVASLFAPDGWLRDRLALTWDLRTFRGTTEIRRVLADRLEAAGLTDLALDERIGPSTIDAGSVGRWVQASFTFETAVVRGRGLVRLIEPAATPVAWTLLLDLRELKDHPEPRGRRRPAGVTHGPTRSRSNWLDRRRRESAFVDGDPAVLVIGAGQSGLAIAARLGQLGVPTLVLERRPRIGDTWRDRYHSLVLHDPIWANHLPYLQFPDTWPRFIAKDKLADWFEAYADIMELNVWTDSGVGTCSYDEKSGTWRVVVEGGDGGERVVHPRHLVFATGHSGLPKMPEVPGLEGFSGEVLHSSSYTGPEGLAGKDVIVVGAGNSSHDICHDLAEAGVSVTMVQRSRTYVHSSQSAFEIAQKGLYDEDGPGTEDADHLANSMPLPVLFDYLNRHVTPQIRARDAELREGLRRAGFALDEDHSLLELYLTRGGGYYIDVGASTVIAEGRIAVRSGVGVDRFTQEGIAYSDGTEQRADTVIFATGYGSMADAAQAIVGDEIAGRCKPVWGVEEEGEMNSVWRSSGHPGIWFFGGNLAFVRHFSLTVALQIKAAEEGMLDRYQSSLSPRGTAAR